MADVKTVDIDGSQWNIKDQEARNEITTLKTEVNTNIPDRFTTDEKRIDGIYKRATGNSIRDCCNKISYAYDNSGITGIIDYVFLNPSIYNTGVYSLSIGGPAFLVIVQNLNANFMSVIATGYTTDDIFKATKNNGGFTLGVIRPTSSID